MNNIETIRASGPAVLQPGPDFAAKGLPAVSHSTGGDVDYPGHARALGLRPGIAPASEPADVVRLSQGLRFEHRRSRNSAAAHHLNLVILGGARGDHPYWKAIEFGGAWFKKVAVVGLEEQSPVTAFAHGYAWAPTASLRALAAENFLRRLGDDTVLLDLGRTTGLPYEILTRCPGVAYAMEPADDLTPARGRVLSRFSAQLHPVYDTLFTQGALCAMDFCSRRKGWARTIRRVTGEFTEGDDWGAGQGSRPDGPGRERHLLMFLIRILQTAGQPFVIFLDPADDAGQWTDASVAGTGRQGAGGRLRFRVVWEDGQTIRCELRHARGGGAARRQVRFFGDGDRLLGDVDLSPDGFMPQVRIVQALRCPQPELGPSFEEECRIRELFKFSQLLEPRAHEQANGAGAA